MYFDDFKVEHVKSPVIESQSYYPFGLTFDNFQRENSSRNRYLYNQGTNDNTFNTERVIELDLNVDQSKDRTLDYITGRWWQVDPKGDAGGQESWSTYQFAFNNPIRYNDPKGDCPPIICGAIAGAVIGGVAGAAVAIWEGKDTKSVLSAAGSGAVNGAIIGSGAGLLAGGATATTGVVATLAKSAVGRTVVRAAVGYVAGAAESIVEQGIDGMTGNNPPAEPSTAKMVKGATVSAVANVIAGPAGKVLEKVADKIAPVVAKKVAEKTATGAAATGQEVVGEMIVNKISNVAKDLLNNNSTTNSNSPTDKEKPK